MTTENPREYTAETDRIKTLEAENEILRSHITGIRAELADARKRVKWYSKLVARLCKADLDRKVALYGKGNRPLD